MINIWDKDELPPGVVAVLDEQHVPDDIFDGGCTIVFWVPPDEADLEFGWASLRKTMKKSE